MDSYTKITREGHSFITVRSFVSSDQIFAPNSKATDVVSVGWQNSLQGYKDPNWKSNVRNHNNATTPLDATSRQWRVKKGEYRSREIRNPPYYPLAFEVKERSCYVFGAIGGMPITGSPPNEDATVANAAVIGFLKKIRATQRHFQGGVFLGEARETLHMLRNPAKALRLKVAAHLEMLTKTPRRRRRNPKFLADSWLEAQFGWAPFMNDVKEASDVLVNLGRNLQDEYEEVRFASKKTTLESITLDVQSWSNIRIWCKTQRTVRNRSYVRYIGSVRIRNAGTPSVDKELLGFSLRDFVPTVWELVPWSFLIDYFSNIGDVIEAWTTCTSDLAWCNRTSIRTRISRSESFLDLPATAGAFWTGQGCRGNAYGNGGWVEVRDKRVVRSIGLSDSPRISFEIPGFGKKWINIAALTSARRELRNYHL